MPIRRVALIFDNKARPETTGVYVRRALDGLVEIEHYLPSEMSRIPRAGFDLYLSIDDGLEYRLAPDLRPCAWWAIDTHLNFDWCRAKAQDFDLVFAAQRDGAERLRAHGIASATWLPLACDPEIHCKHEAVKKRHDVAFVGHVFPGPRAELLELVSRRFPNTFIGQRYFEEMAETYSAARIVFNRSICNDVNMRVFEALACGSLLVTNDLTDNGQGELFRDGVHLATYRDPEELLDKVAYYLARTEARERIAAAGRAEVLDRHTYRHRMKRLLNEVETVLARSPAERRGLAPSLRGACPLSGGSESPNGDRHRPDQSPNGDRHRPDQAEDQCRVPFSGRSQSPEAPNGDRHRPDQAEDQCRVPFSGRSQSPFCSASDAHDASYFDHVRPEILVLIPRWARSVLDIGCGAGRLGEALKARQPARVVGIEFDPRAVRRAQERLDEVLVGDVEQLEPGFAPGSFDAVVCGDILEHLHEPERLLRRIRAWLAPQGRFVASVPNVRHHSVVRALLEGNWTYEAAGLLDRDHIRFFTRRELEKLLWRAGFDVREIRIVPGPGDDVLRQDCRPGEVKVGRIHVAGMEPAEADEFYAYQFLVTAQPAPRSDFGLTSIVIVTHNQLQFTHPCVDSLRRLTDEPFELICVDNASTDATVEYLHSIPGAKVIVNAENRGFPAAVNQGIEAASGRQVLLLNNDTIVTTGWLARLLGALRGDPRIGLVGPCSNCVSGPQQVGVGYDDLAGLDGFAWDWGKAHDGQVEDSGRLVGFCLLMRREVIDAIGLFDERFGVGCFEDDDYCVRALGAGWRAVIARDAFVHHFGGRTFVGSGVDFTALMHENQRRFEEKWRNGSDEGTGSESSRCLSPFLPDEGTGSESSRCLSPFLHHGPPAEGTGSESSRCLSPFLHGPAAAKMGTGTGPADPEAPAATDQRPGASPRFAAGRLAVDVRPGGGLLLRRERPRLSLCLIACDSARTLPACLESIRPWVDEMVVVDTGSTDDTVAVARSYGARVFHFAWCDDFSAARNVSLRHARGDWLFWMDSDDTISAECGKKLRALADREHDRAVFGYVVQVHCPGGGDGEDPDADVTVVDHVKLIRNRPDLRFEGRIHEQILPAIRRAGGEVAWTDLYVVHSGSDHSAEAQARKRERDLRLLHLEIKERPKHPFTLFNLGMTYADAEEFEAAAEYLARGIARAERGESHLRKAYALLVYSQMRLGRLDDAEATCRAGLELFALDAELRFRWGVLLHELGRNEESVRVYLDLLERQEPRHFTSVDRALTSFKARQNLAVVYASLGEWAKAERQWREVVRAVPRYREGWRGLGEVLLCRGKRDEAQALADYLEAESTEAGWLRGEGLLLRGRAAASRGDLTGARNALGKAVAAYPDELEPLRALSQFLFEHGTPEEAERALEELARRAPKDASVQHNLGLMALRQHRSRAAEAAFRRSLELRPDTPATLIQLGHVLKLNGQLDEAITAWQQAQRLDPNDRAATEALRTCTRAGIDTVALPV